MKTKEATADVALGLRVGDLVEVRSESEILATLDENGELDSLPFMPEMLQFCGQRFTVYKVAHKLCDTMTKSGMRRMRDAVHLSGVRCAGKSHGGCEAACLIYWKEAWLKRADALDGKAAVVPIDDPTPRCTLPILEIRTRRSDSTSEDERFSCQATELLRAAPELLPFRDTQQYVQDLRSGNTDILSLLRWIFVGLFNRIQKYSTRVLPKWLWFRGGLPWRFLRGTAGQTTPLEKKNLQPGERVRIRSKEEILKTLNKDLLNRGMGFDEEMSRFCGREGRVLRRVEHIINEKTGKMLHLKNPCIVLEGIFCVGVYNANCPRAIYCYWRENWLERIDEPQP